MKKEKLYFTRYHDQWKGKDVELVEDEVNVYDLYIQVPDLEMEEGSVNLISANFRTKDGVFIETVACEIYDVSKRMIKLKMPLFILANNGIYEVDFSVSYNKNGSNKTDEKTAIQTFTILDTIDISDEEIANDDRYNVLQKLIDDLANYKVDTSNFASKEEVQEMIDTATEGITIESIKAELEGVYITPTQMNTALSNYVTKFDSAQFAKSSDLNAYAKTTWVNGQLSYYATNEKLSNYVLKENGKSLTSNDFTDELREKLINIPEDGSDYDDSELRELINKKADTTTVIDLVNSINKIDKDNYYEKTVIDEYMQNISNTHTEDIENINNEINEIENTYLKKEDYEYADGINTDDVRVNEMQNLTQLIEELTYKEIEINDFSTNFITNVYEKGTSLNEVTLKWNLSKIPLSQMLDLQEVPNNTTSITLYETINDTREFKLTVSDEKNTKEATVRIEFVKPFLYGTHAEDYLSNATVEGGQKIIDVRNTQTVELTYVDSKLFFAYPMSYGYLSEIKDNNGFSYFNEFINELMYVNDETYIVYKFEERVSVQNISFTFFFAEEEE